MRTLAGTRHHGYSTSQSCTLQRVGMVSISLRTSLDSASRFALVYFILALSLDNGWLDGDGPAAFPEMPHPPAPQSVARRQMTIVACIHPKIFFPKHNQHDRGRACSLSTTEVALAHSARPRSRLLTQHDRGRAFRSSPTEDQDGVGGDDDVRGGGHPIRWAAVGRDTPRVTGGDVPRARIVGVAVEHFAPKTARRECYLVAVERLFVEARHDHHVLAHALDPALEGQYPVDVMGLIGVESVTGESAVVAPRPEEVAHETVVIGHLWA